MKVRCLAVVLLAIASAPNAVHAAECNALKPYLEDLSAGRKPAGPPDVQGCTDSGPDTPAVAAALKAFIDKSKSAEDFNAVFEQLRTTYEEKQWRTPYAELAAALGKGLLPGFTVHKRDYALLDGLPEYVRRTHPAMPPPADPKAKGGAPVAGRIVNQTVYKADPFPWLPWSLLGVAILLAPIPLLATVRWVLRLLERARAEEAELARRLSSTATKADAALLLLNDNLQATSSSLGAKVSQVSLLRLEDFQPVADAVGTVREDLARMIAAVEELATKPTAGAADPVALEHQVLGESWKDFSGNAALRAAFDEAAANPAWEPLLDELPKHIPADLQSSFDTVYAPCKEHRVFVKKLALIPRVIDRTIRRRPSDAEELRRTRELAGVLATAQAGADGASPLNFRFKRWVTDTFLPFADLYLQRSQQAELEKRGEDLAAGANLVRRLLLIASVEAIDVKLGETAFDSARHIGRATTNDPRFADGVITGVVRNGFIEGGKKVIRQPEVIVNRMR
jgi:hypothetical protein